MRTELSPPPLVVVYVRRQRASAVRPLFQARLTRTERRITATTAQETTAIMSVGTM
ncbi:hypothetical protein SPURM210S_02072 [Streptomyces purpurascens]